MAAAANTGGAGGNTLSASFSEALAQIEATQNEQLAFQQQVTDLQTKFQAESAEIENESAMAQALRTLTRTISQSLRQG
ncbi:MAG: hypothetical protein CSA79_03675 [Thiothrix nivea]|nr:MAG: hypothetical protein CSA79_03675 [Thiothrix nivea]